MANPKKKHTRMRRNMRRAHNWRIQFLQTSRCSHCGEAMLSHRICPSCGFYGEELVLPKKVKKAKGEEEEEK